LELKVQMISLDYNIKIVAQRSLPGRHDLRGVRSREAQVHGASRIMQGSAFVHTLYNARHNERCELAVRRVYFAHNHEREHDLGAHA